MARTRFVAPEEAESSEPEGNGSGSEAEFIVEQILNHKPKKAGLPMEDYKYLVRWKGFTPADDSWEPFDCFDGAVETVRSYYEKHISKSNGATASSSRKRAKAADSETEEGSRSLPKTAASPDRKRRVIDVNGKTKAPTPKKRVQTETEEDDDDDDEVVQPRKSLTALGQTDSDEEETERRAPSPPKKRMKPKPAARPTSQISSPPTERKEWRKASADIPLEPEESDQEVISTHKAQKRLDKLAKRHNDEADWEDYVQKVSAVRLSPHFPAESGRFQYEVQWEDGTGCVYGWLDGQLLTDKCPRPVIAYLQEHISFKN